MWSRNRAVVTGLGPVAACGSDLQSYWDAIQHGRSGIGFITLFDSSDFDTHVAGEVKDFDLQRYIEPLTPVRRLARQTQLALAAAKLAFDDAGLTDQLPKLGGAIPVTLGVSTSSYSMIETAVAQMSAKGPDRIVPYISSASQPQQAASIIAEQFGLVAQAHTFASACPSGLDAVHAAAELVRGGKTDIALAGGADAPVCALGIACLQQSGLVSRKDLPPEKSSRPFNRDNDSGVISEGAGVVIIENYETARARGAHIYFEILGFASCVDPLPQEPGSGLGGAMQHALAEAAMLPQDIDYICAHGSGHPVLDRAEVKSIKQVFGPHAYRIPVSSIKGAVGNPLAAAGLLQLIACGCALRHGLVPPTANLEIPDAACDLDHVPGRGRRCQVNRILVNAHGLGGGNSSLVIRRVDAP